MSLTVTATHGASQFVGTRLSGVVSPALRVGLVARVDGKYQQDRASRIELLCYLARQQELPMIPQTYEEWRHCIEVECGLSLTPAFIAERLAELSNPDHERTRQFVRLYGDAHRMRVIEWFKRAKD